MGGAALMRLLFDTHVWLWSVLQPELVPGKVKAELDRPSNELWLSPISIWELLTLSQRGRVVLARNQRRGSGERYHMAACRRRRSRTKWRLKFASWALRMAIP